MFVELEVGSVTEVGTMAPRVEQQLGDQGMVQQERWEEIRRMRFEQRMSVSGIARRLDLDRKTVRRCLRQSEWRPYERAPKAETLLREHAHYLRERAVQVNYSARILYQELRARRSYSGSYDTVKRFVAPLRESQRAEELCQMRFETGPGEQSQIDWGQLGTHFRAQPVTLHIFVLTLGFSRRGYYYACADEQLSQFLEAHERAFEHFGGLAREHLYDRPRTVCYPDDEGRRVWNPTFKAFSEYWGFEPRVCRGYRAQTKGKVESGVKYVKRNFAPGRSFLDIVDFQAQLDEWNASIADQRVHGTTHERPVERFEREREHLIALAGQPGFQLARSVSRIIAEDWLVSYAANRYSVPFRLIGQTVSVQREGEWLRIRHRDELVAEHPLLAGKHQVRILPEHGPGATARNRRTRRAAAPPAPGTQEVPQVEIRDLALYEQLCAPTTIEEVAS
jgi:transposase